MLPVQRFLAPAASGALRSSYRSQERDVTIVGRTGSREIGREPRVLHFPRAFHPGVHGTKRRHAVPLRGSRDHAEAHNKEKA